MSYQSPVYDDPAIGGVRAPAPERDPVVMTSAEAARFLRLDENRDIGDAVRSLQPLVKSGRLRPLIIARGWRFARAELLRFVAAEGIMLPDSDPPSDSGTDGNLP